MSLGQAIQDGDLFVNILGKVLPPRSNGKRVWRVTQLEMEESPQRLGRLVRLKEKWPLGRPHRGPVDQVEDRYIGIVEAASSNLARSTKPRGKASA